MFELKPNTPNYFYFFFVILGNACVLPGVLLWDWSIFEVFYLYWFENVLIGCFTVIRMMMASASQGIWALFSSLFRIAFFIVHYGMFCMGHGLILTEIFYDNPLDVPIEPETLFQIPIIVGMQGFLYGAIGIVLIEIVYGIQKVLQDRREGNSADVIMFSPYGRIVVLHVAVILGGLLAQEFGVSIMALVVLVVLKTIYDVAILKGFKKQKGIEA